MKIDHVCGGHVYVISNFGVARNPIFFEQSDVEFFQSNIEKYLSGICEIYAYSFLHNQFQILIRVNSRNIIEKFFETKMIESKNVKYQQRMNDFQNGIVHSVYPETYEIFSQEVSNMLNSYAKYFNYKYKRCGSLFGRRYLKILLESEVDLKNWINKLNNQEPLFCFESDWQAEKKCNFRNNEGECSSLIFYGEKGFRNFHTIFSNFWPYFRIDLRGCFNFLPPANIRKQNYLLFQLKFLHSNGYFPPW